MRIGVVGAGIIGLAVARRLGELRPDATVTVLEKERAIATHQTGRNSGVVHAGIYYAPGSLKAQLCRRGVELLRAYCEERGIPIVDCGKLVVALDASELDRLRELERRAATNGVPGMRWLEGDELREIEPHAAGIAGLHSPTTGITDYRAVAAAFAEDVGSTGGSVVLGAEVVGISTASKTVRVETVGAGVLDLDRLAICAGLQSDRVALLAGDERDPAIVPFRGEYYRLRPEREGLVRGLVYPVPDPAYPFLGVHFTRRVHGGVDVGPNAVLAFAREGYRRRDVRLGDLFETLRSRGFRALARAHWRMAAHELRGSLSKRAFAAEARRYVPEVTADDLVPAPAGVRAQALDPDGSLVDDFRITRLGAVTAVRNAPSPGATSSLAIAEYVADRVLQE
ncbi:L-2-hydroxyglutarate oxidase [Gaiella sp.]|jgi:L-2-hydroxyglutarate oxidase LhgO|uniref:L-2-hydroxyglutarate oxidase n=1 Tax=Gaiella sp. TaxID=2663207 RepID=UPI002E2F98D9|nr:L-2-hydroxyglutarate oxidase [Gaiella sp.]HEX5583791.1 L-2-hydroxyglutarate oxidase [Gaiella sp.]